MIKMMVASVLLGIWFFLTVFLAVDNGKLRVKNDLYSEKLREASRDLGYCLYEIKKLVMEK
jgi:hypothetical protein